MQSTNRILMIRPANFGYNKETAENNTFQQIEGAEHVESIKKAACNEFDTFVEILSTNGIEVEVVQDSKTPVKPDAVFPNNWLSMHEDGTIITYPMFAVSRRTERDERIIDFLAEKYSISRRYSFDHYEDEAMFLEGTGSMIFDRTNKIVYACLSPRTDIRLLDKFCVLMSCTKEVFHATDDEGHDIYHTNVMMAIGETFVVICLEAVRDTKEKKQLISSFFKTNKAIIEISIDQMKHFAANMLEVINKTGQRFLVMSEQAFGSLRRKQIEDIEKHTNIIRAPLYTIEKYGGGSARCMMAEVFLPVR